MSGVLPDLIVVAAVVRLIDCANVVLATVEGCGNFNKHAELSPKHSASNDMGRDEVIKLAKLAVDDLEDREEDDPADNPNQTEPDVQNVTGNAEENVDNEKEDHANGKGKSSKAGKGREDRRDCAHGGVCLNSSEVEVAEVVASADHLVSALLLSDRAVVAQKHVGCCHHRQEQGVANAVAVNEPERETHHALPAVERIATGAVAGHREVLNEVVDDGRREEEVEEP